MVILQKNPPANVKVSGGKLFNNHKLLSRKDKYYFAPVNRLGFFFFKLFEIFKLLRIFALSLIFKIV